MNDFERAYELEQKGLKANREDNDELALRYFKELTEVAPDYENGLYFTELAIAYDILGKVDEAEKAYLKALEYDDEDDYRLENYASFTHGYREPEVAFEVYIRLLKNYKNWQWHERVEEVLPNLYELGEKMGWDKDKIQKAIDEA